MHISVGAPLILIVLLGGFVLLVLFFLNFISVRWMEMSRHHPESPGPSAGRTHSFRRGFFTAIFVAIAILVVIRIKSDRQAIQVDGEVTFRRQESRSEAMQDLAEAKRDIQKALSEVADSIPEIPGIPSLSLPSEQGLDSASQKNLAGRMRALASATSVGSDATAAVSASDNDQDKPKRFSELSAFSQRIRERLNRMSPQTSGATGIAQAAESANGDVVVFELSDQMTKELLGESGRALLKSLDSDVPERIRQTFAVIPLTSPVDPVSPMNPLMANGALEAIANVIMSMTERPVAPAAPESTQSVVVSENPAGVAADADAAKRLPDWVEKPGAGRIVVKTEPLLSGDSEQEPLTNAINRALAEHLSQIAETMDPVLREQARFVRLELDSATAEHCIVSRFERFEELETGVEGPKPFRQVYALLEFPETVDAVAEQKIRQSLQSDRMVGLGVIVMFGWLAVCSAGCCIRLWNSGAGWLKMMAVPVTGLAALGMVLCAAALTIAFARGAMPRPPWDASAQRLMIHVDSHE